jgi:hypothetical protein
MENDPFLVLAAAFAGGLAYYILEPFFPKFDEADLGASKVCGLHHTPDT